MSGRSSLEASTEQRAALRELAGSTVRGEADRARAVLLTLSGWTAGQIGQAFGVGEDAVRRWRQWFTQGGVEALRATLAPGPAAERGEGPWPARANSWQGRCRTGRTGRCRGCAPPSRRARACACRKGT